VSKDGASLQVRFLKALTRDESIEDVPPVVVTDPVAMQLLSRADSFVLERPYVRPDYSRSIDPSWFHHTFDRTEAGRAALVANMLSGAEYALALTDLADTVVAVAADAGEPSEHPQIVDKLLAVKLVRDCTADRLMAAYPDEVFFVPGNSVDDSYVAVSTAYESAVARNIEIEDVSDLALALRDARKFLA
jgi:hypothetical protein